MSKDTYLGKESSRQRRQPVQESHGIRMPGMFKALKKAGMARAEFEGCRGAGDGVREPEPGGVGLGHM